VNTIALLVIQEVTRARGFAGEEVDRAIQTHPLIFAGLPISEAVALGALSFRVDGAELTLNSIAARHRSSGASRVRNGPSISAGQPGLRNFSM
jgi:hypothetical protein